MTKDRSPKLPNGKSRLMNACVSEVIEAAPEFAHEAVCHDGPHHVDSACYSARWNVEGSCYGGD